MKVSMRVDNQTLIHSFNHKKQGVWDVITEISFRFVSLFLILELLSEHVELNVLTKVSSQLTDMTDNAAISQRQSSENKTVKPPESQTVAFTVWKNCFMGFQMDIGVMVAMETKWSLSS